MAKKRTSRKTQSNRDQSAQYGDQTVTVGAGGETHQTADGGVPGIDHSTGHSGVG